MKKNCICCVLLFVMLFSVVVYAGYGTESGEDGAGYVDALCKVAQSGVH